MKRSRITAFVVALTLLLSATLACANDFSQTLAYYRQSPLVQPYFDSAYGYAVFPTVGKGGLIVGMSYGQGQVYRQGQLTGTAILAKTSFGIQLGGQAFSELIFFQDQQAYDSFVKGRVEFEATASAVAITVGAQANAGTDGATASYSTSTYDAQHHNPGYRRGLAIFVNIKGGLMYEASIGGQGFQFTPLQSRQ